MELKTGMYVRFKDKNGCNYIRKVIDVTIDTILTNTHRQARGFSPLIYNTEVWSKNTMVNSHEDNKMIYAENKDYKLI